MTTRKTIALTRRTFVGKVMSLLFNMLSRLVIILMIISDTIIVISSVLRFKLAFFFYSPLGTASVVSHKFWYVVLPLFFVQRYFFSFSASLTHSSEACCSTYTYLWTSHVFSCYWFPVSDHCGPLDCKDIKPVSPKGNLPWIFTGRTNVEAEALKLWLTDVKSWLTGTDPDAGKDWRQKEKGATEDEMAR